MNLKNCVRGDKVKLPGIGGGYWCHVAYYLGDDVVVGWYSDESWPAYAVTWPPGHCRVLDDDGREIISKFSRCRWEVVETAVLERIQACSLETTKPTLPSGLHCAGPCHEYNSYAVPNQPDGSYVCFSCRSTSWKYK